MENPFLSSSAIAAIQETWIQLEEYTPKLAEFHYNALFEEDPDVQYLFKRDIGNHGINLMDSVQTVVECIENLSNIVGYLNRLGTRHKGYRVKKRHYPIFESTLIDTFTWGLELTNQKSAESTDAWCQLIKFITNCMKDGNKR